MLYLTLALLIAVVAGLRAMIAPAAVSWAAYLGWLNLENSWLAFLGYTYTPWILTLLAIAELFNDKRPTTESRTVPVQFSGRIFSGALCGAALGIGGQNILAGIVLGIAGAVIGTLGGRAFRGRLATTFGRDLPAALTEDVIAIGGALLIVTLIR
jgi:uncharacterized membrane protein